MSDELHEQRDSLYAKPLGQLERFTFDEAVVRVFPDMIRRSVPGYSTIIAMTGLLAGRYAQDNSHCYDLGCSLGASTLAMRQQLEGKQCRIIAVDNSEAMLERCASVIGSDVHNTPVELINSDIRHTDIKNASVVVLNFTLQFIAPEERLRIMQTIADGMLPGGILILSEKIIFDDPHLQDLNTDLHHEFKRANGYSDLEISQKRSALENFLQAETLNTHRQRLQQAGFSSIDVWFQCFNFASMVAIR
jgi:tRNA (cmo5U34)-methyltransferase